MKCIYCVLLLLCAYVSKAQGGDSLVKAIAIGGKLPDLKFKNVLNASYTNAAINQYKQDLLILDFWASWCGACIKSFAKLPGLQQQFKKELAILLVNSPSSGDDLLKVKQVLDRQQARGINLKGIPVLMQEHQLAQLFPYTSLPHVVWIYKGRLKAISTAAELTAANIEAVLQGKEWTADQKVFDTNFTTRHSLMDSSNAPFPLMLQQVTFTGYRPGVGGRIGQHISADSQYRRHFFINQSIARLYSLAVPAVSANRLFFVNAADSLLLQGDYWNKRQLYCFEITLPASLSRQRIQNIVLKQLDAQFGFSSRFETITTDAWALQITNAKDSLFVSDSTATGNEPKLLHNAPVSQLLFLLNVQRPGTSQRPVILDETGYTGLLNMQLPISDWQNLPSVNKALQAYGLALVPCKRKVEMLMIYPANSVHSLFTNN